MLVVFLPTAALAGTPDRPCSYCGDTLMGIYPKPWLDYSHTYWCSQCNEKYTSVFGMCRATGPATCADPAVCICGRIMASALGHDYSADYTVDTPATCTAEGSKSQHCSRCESKNDVTAIPALGHDLIHHDPQAPTCTEIGWDAFDTCFRCDYSTYVEVPTLGHDLIHHDPQAPTCTEIGWDAFDTCSRCNYSTYEIIAALGHGIVHHDPQAPTCTEIGWDAYDTCARCDYTTYEIIPALGHGIVHHDPQAPTCTEIGWDAYDTCARCDYTTYEIIPALGHGLIHHDPQAATCTEIGWYAFDTCSRCDYTTYVEIPALGHDLLHHDPQAPTCTEIGWDAFDTCSRCDYSTYVEIAKLGHDLAHHDAKAPTCTEIGWATYDTCARCDYTTYEIIPALGHGIVQHDPQAPTCTEIGWDAYDTCARCDYTTYIEIPALGHDYLADYTVDVAATCTTEGSKSQHCSRCESKTNVTVIPALGHSFLSYQPNDDATCIADGTKTAKCERCDGTDTVADPGSAKGHHYKRTVIAPTCTAKGYTTYECINCADTYRADFENALMHRFGLWESNGDGTHSARCMRSGCNHVGTAECSHFGVTADGNIMPCCFICGTLGDERLLAFEFAEIAAIDLGAIPGRGELILRGINDPFDGALYALTAAYEYAGLMEPFAGAVTVSIPLELNDAFRLVRVDVIEKAETNERSEAWTEIPFTYEEGILSFETDTAGLFLILPVE